MNRNRSDLSNWIIHFVHDRNAALEPYVDTDWPSRSFVHSYDDDGQPKRNEYPICDEDFPLDENASAFQVLQKILFCGYLKAGYSFRQTKNGVVPTIYGPKPAVCFTEMPLNSFLDYTKSRNDKQNITSYGIAFHRMDLFNMGARPVIYGTSGEHQEARSGDIFYQKGHRTLDSSCGIGLKEQYRYVYTRLSPINPVDWTHEREWRWADLSEQYDTPGLPFLLRSLSYNLNSIFVLVNTDTEVQELQNLVQGLYHKESNYAGDDYKLNLLAEMRIVSLESLTKTADLTKVRIEDFASLKVAKKLPRYNISDALKDLIKTEVAEALKLLDEFEEQTAAIDKSADSPIQRDALSFVSIVTYDSSTEITQAMLDLGYLQTDNGRYLVSHPRLGNRYTPYYTLAQQAFEKIAEYLTLKLKQEFYCDARMD